MASNNDDIILDIGFNLNITDMQDVIQASMKKISKSTQDILGNTDTSKFTSRMLSAYNSIERNIGKVTTAQRKFNETVEELGSSTNEYQAAQNEIMAMDNSINSLRDKIAKLQERLKLGLTTTGSKEAIEDAKKELQARESIVLNLRSKQSELQQNLSADKAVLSLNRDNVKQIEKELSLLAQQRQELTSQRAIRANIAKTNSLQSQLGQNKEIIDTKSANIEATRKAIASVSGQISQANKGVNSAKASLASLTAPMQMTADEIAQINAQITSYTNRIKSLQAVKASISTSGSDYTYNISDSKSVEKLAPSYFKLYDAINSVNSAVKRFNVAQQAATEQENKARGAAESHSKSSNASANSTNKLARELRKTGKVFLGIGKSISSVGKRISSLIGQFGQLSKISDRTTRNMSKGFKKLASNITMYALGFRSLYFLVKRLQGTFIAGMGTLAMQSSKVNGELSALKTAFLQLKGSLTTAFQPIASYVIPLLVSLMNHLSGVLTMLGQFFATLTGQKYIYKATAAQQNYAESISGVKDSAKQANKELAKYDNLLVESQDTPSSGGGGAGKAPLDGVTYEKVDLDSGISEFAKKIKQAWKKADFTEIGNIVGTKLKNAIDTIPWDTIFDFSERIGKSLGTFINGFVEVPGLADSLGRVIGNAFNTAMIGLDAFLTSTNWMDVGQFIADWANSSINTFHWDLLGKTVADLVMAGVNTWYKFVGPDGFDFKNLGSKIATAINTFLDTMAKTDATGLTGWQKLGISISNSIKGILELMITALNEIDWTKVGTAIGQLISSIDWKGIAIDVTKLVEAIVDAIGDTFDGWSKTDPVSAGIAKFLALAILGVKIAPTIIKIVTLFLKVKEAIGLVSEGAGGLSGIFSKLATFGSKLAGIGMIIGGAVTAVSSFVDMWNNGWSIIGEILKDLGIAIAAIGVGITTTIGAPVIAIVAAITAAVTTIVIVVKDHWEDIKKVFGKVADWFSKNVIEPVKKFFKDLGEKISGFFTNAWNKIKSIWKAVKTWFKVHVVDPVKTLFSNLKDKVVGFFKNPIDSIHKTWNNLHSWFSNHVTKKITKIFKTAVDKIGGFFSGLWSGIKNGAKAAFNWVVGKLEGLINGIFGGINAVIGGLNKVIGAAGKVVGQDWSGVPKLGKVKLPRLAQGGVIPPNKEFLAVLGDQKRGTNIEAPLDTIKQGVREVLAELGGIGGTQMPESIKVYLSNNRAIAEAVWDEEEKRYKQTGRRPSRR